MSISVFLRGQNSHAITSDCEAYGLPNWNGSLSQEWFGANSTIWDGTNLFYLFPMILIQDIKHMNLDVMQSEEFSHESLRTV